MVLSGYLFFKLLNGRRIQFKPFLWNRLVRLGPLLLIVLLLAGWPLIQTPSGAKEYGERILSGLVLPTLPNGGWSITVEFHFYLILPILLLLQERSRHSLAAIVGISVLTRLLLFERIPELQAYSYWTIIGRIDQFLLGALAFLHGHRLSERHSLMTVVALLFLLLYWQFDFHGGFYKCPPGVLRVLMPTAEGVAYAVGVAWYDTSFRHSAGFFSRVIARVGTYSYSIYLLHFFVVFKLSTLIHKNIINLSNLHIALAVSPIAFCVMYPIAAVSYNVVEVPFLRFRKRYILPEASQSVIDPA